MASKRQRSDGVVIAESSNIVEDAKRICATRASENIQEFNKRRPRGRGKHASSTLEGCSLSQALKSRPGMLEKGQQILQSYVDVNTTFVVQKAMALNIFAVSMREGSGVLDACTEAAKFTGFNAEVIRRWAEAVFRDFFFVTANIDNVDDELLESELKGSTQSGFLSFMMRVSSSRPPSM